MVHVDVVDGHQASCRNSRFSWFVLSVLSVAGMTEGPDSWRAPGRCTKYKRQIRTPLANAPNTNTRTYDGVVVLVETTEVILQNRYQVRR